ncbi:hypothetical protein [Nitratiruptor sp. YY09-18]|uniref:hypothetical protein n=1 Tax=Nitratiruptor sp. YY09-18 TaxID=2724901 RepID=UPI001915F1E5|nr:hypothetical protein [Nitratiruptor sp. YY09-18]BCD68851.1 hypothetical protein NitYY0918_C1770 [Nitratiruptor sp. YY09-18]
MVDFLREELVYILIALFIMAIAAFVVTRPFVDLNAKKVLGTLGVVLFAALLAHYSWRMHHIKEVKAAFEQGKNILCLDKTNKIGYVLVKKGEWKLKGDELVHPEFPRGYNVRSCIEE